MNFTFGTDPEFMVVDQNDNFRSAITFVKGDRKNRIKIGEFGFYYDNVLAECAVKPAGSNAEAIINIRTALQHYKEILDPHGVKIIPQAAAEYNDAELDTGKLLKSPLGGMVQEGRYAGCKAEKCAYILNTLKPTELQEKIRHENLRTAGGHVHLGTELGKFHLPCVSLIRTMDLFVGLPLLILDQDKSGLLRRKLYGAAGRYRQPPWGAEYRTLSNYWLSSPRLVDLVYDLCAFCVEFVEAERHKEFWHIDEEKLDSDDFWNSGGDPADLHICFGYDSDKLRGLFEGKGNTDEGGASEYIDIIKDHLPSELFDKIQSLAWPSGMKPKTDFYEEWAL